MTFEFPKKDHIPALKRLWKEAFFDTDEFLDQFFTLEYSPRRCRIALEDGQPAAVLYWLELACRGKKMAYIYAVTTDSRYRHRGLCTRLMEDALAHMEDCAGAVLLPADEGLRAMYGAMGFRDAAPVGVLTCRAGRTPVSLKPVTGAAYLALRQRYAPAGGAAPREAAFLESQYGLYAGEDFVLAARVEQGRLTAAELLGSRDAASGILQALGAETGTFRYPGGETPFLMYRSLDGTAAPDFYPFTFE